MRFGIHPEAIKELKEARRWYKEQNPDVAVEFRMEIREAVRHIRENPTLYRAIKFGARRYLVNKFPYLLWYIILEDETTIIACAHGKRKPYYWKNRI